MPIKLSKKAKFIEKSIDKLPEFYRNYLIAVRKTDADKFIDQFKKNLRHNCLSIEPLSPITIDGKEREGKPKPSTPLYGLGDTNNKTYINMFLLRKLKNGWKAYPRWAKHHEADLSLRQLFEIHEYGRTIKRGEKFIRIPPRPIAWLTYRKNLLEMKKKKSSKEFKKAITEYINKGNENLLKKVIKYNSKYTEGIGNIF
jgi:hypothetical protein